MHEQNNLVVIENRCTCKVVNTLLDFVDKGGMKFFLCYEPDNCWRVDGRQSVECISTEV